VASLNLSFNAEFPELDLILHVVTKYKAMLLRNLGKRTSHERGFLRHVQSKGPVIAPEQHNGELQIAFAP